MSLVDCFDTMVEIVSVAGNNRLGGDDFDRLIAEHFLREHGVARQQLRAQEYAVLMRVLIRWTGCLRRVKLC